MKKSVICVPFTLQVYPPVYIHRNASLKNFISHNYNTRSNDNQHVNIPNSKKNINLRFINYLAPKFYNQLPCVIKQYKNLKKFTNLCKTYVNQNFGDFTKFL